MSNLASSLVKAQKAFAPALKSKANPHFKSRYADLASCVDAVIDALNDNGIAILQPTRPSETGIIVQTLFVHESGEKLEAGELFFPAPKNDPQGFMSALTYARRGSLMSACGIAPEDDDGNAASQGMKQTSTKTDPAVQSVAAKVAETKSVEDLNELFASLATEELRKKMTPTFKARKAEIMGVAQ